MTNKITRLIELIKDCQVLQAEAMSQVVKHRKKQERAFKRLLKELK